jgi:class 3 adenylate cyclase
MNSHAERMIFAISAVPGSTKACAARGDSAMFETLQAYYSIAAQAAVAADGRFIKAMGDGVLLSFPIDRAAEAIQELRTFQERSTMLWHSFDERCHVQVKVGAGTVQCGLMGAPGAEHVDLVGNALNALFKAAWTEFDISPDVAALLADRQNAG